MTRRCLLQTLLALPFAARREPAARRVALSIDLGGRHVCPFQNGYLPVLDLDLRTVTILDTAGSVAASFRSTVPDASVMGVRHIAVSADREVAAAVAAKASDGRYANLLVFSDFQGVPKRIVRTNPFAVFHPLFLPDGRLLCVGREHDEQLNEIEGYNVLRIYSPDGVLLEKAVNINQLRPDRRDPEPIEWDVAVGAGRIAMLDRETLRYVEFDERCAVVRPPAPLAFDRPGRAMGFALLSSGARLVGVDHMNVAGATERFALYLLHDSGAGTAKRLVTEIVPPDGYAGFSVVGTHQDEVVLLTTPVGSLVFAPEPAPSTAGA